MMTPGGIYIADGTAGQFFGVPGVLERAESEPVKQFFYGYYGLLQDAPPILQEVYAPAYK